MSRFISKLEWDETYLQFIKLKMKKNNGSSSIKIDSGQFDMEYFHLSSGITYFSTKIFFKEDIFLSDFAGNEEFSFICFNKSDENAFYNIDNNSKIEFKQNNLWRGSQFAGHKAKSLLKKNTKYNMQSLIFDTALYKQLTPNCEHNNSFKGECFCLDCQKTITNKQNEILSNLEKAKHLNGRLNEIYMEAKILDLVYESFEDKENKNYYESNLNKKDIEALHKAKKILIENYKNPPSLKELAYKSAINEFKLKKGFKEIFGTTVYGYLQQFRLEKSKNLLESDDINIGEAASLVGYKSISHFSKIFKETFGILPIEIKKKQKRIYI